MELVVKYYSTSRIATCEINAFVSEENGNARYGCLNHYALNQNNAQNVRLSTNIKVN
jgi:hypothetical protein